ncbi:MAG TPA: dihydrofolate reductase, partial [bacterium]|nr:dihydrofolate reductase [bacterium]
GVVSPSAVLQKYYYPLEEARADLFSLYFMLDPKLIELGLLPSLDAGKAAYQNTVTKGLLKQLARIELGQDISDSHMRDRHLIASWAYEKGQTDNVIEKIIKEGKTYYVINDYQKLRGLFAQLLGEVQRIISEADYEAGKALVERYGIKINKDLHREVLDRWAKLGVAKYSLFLMPYMKPVLEGDKLVDVILEYPTDFVEQMMLFGSQYSFLPAM